METLLSPAAIELMKLSREDLYFITAYYYEELRGGYPQVMQTDGKTDETNGYLLKHYLRKILRVRDMSVELQMIDLLRNESKGRIIRTAMSFFPEWRQRTDSHDRILCVAKQLLKIKALMKKAAEEAAAPPDTEGVKEGTTAKSAVKYASIADYEAATGKRYRVKKEQAERLKAMGLNRKETRDAAFQEVYGIME